MNILTLPPQSSEPRSPSTFTVAYLEASPLGTLTMEATSRGVVALHFGATGGDGATADPGAARQPEAVRHLEVARHFLAWALDPERARSPEGPWAAGAAGSAPPLPAGGAPPFPKLDLDAARGATPFRRRVWGALLGVGRGEVVSYGELSRRVEAGSPRAVGQAVGANPIPILVPCHRVVTTGGRLGGFSGGLERKVALLTLEGFAPLEADFRARLNRAPARP